MIRRLIERRPAGIRQTVRVSSQSFFRTQCNFAPLMSGEPAAVIVSFVYRDPVNPGLQTAIAPKVSDVLEDLQKDLLNDVGGIRGIVRQTIDQVVDGLLIALEEYFVGIVRALAQRRDQCVLLRYGEDTGILM